MGLDNRDYARDEPLSPWEQHLRERDRQPLSMTAKLIIVNVAVFVIAMLITGGKTGGVVFEWFGLPVEALQKPWQWYRFLTYGFLHSFSSILHLAFNMMALFFLGQSVERRMGRMEYLRFYLVAVVVSGVFGAIGYWIGGATNVNIVGASGAVVAITILFACYFPNQEILLMMVLPVKAWVLAAIVVGSNLYQSMVPAANGAQEATAFTVHLAGAAFAFLYYFQHWNLGWLNVARFKNPLNKSLRRNRLKLHDPDQKMQRQGEEVDEILAKIHRSGEESLTRAERRALEKYSRAKREKRGES
ncbi:MAG: hypothetical protein CBB71_06705 [Rhodopirellula sp. TMED11]|nr:MAG: hypothetical protein CBB71_06705 [Rhodopirellula sp. TMED11]